MRPFNSSEVYKGTGTDPKSLRKMGRTGQSLDSSICAHILCKFFVHARWSGLAHKGLGLWGPLSLEEEERVEKSQRSLGFHISWH